MITFLGIVAIIALIIKIGVDAIDVFYKDSDNDNI